MNRKSNKLLRKVYKACLSRDKSAQFKLTRKALKMNASHKKVSCVIQ